jgi:acid ceramidase
MPELIVDLNRAAVDRWQLDSDQIQQACELVLFYKNDLGLRGDAADLILAGARELCTSAHWLEMEAIADRIALPVADVVLCNLYYDAIKVVLGCTAFGVEQADGVLHARNLDWTTQSGILGRFTLVTRFVGAPAGEFVTIGWPGFVGVLSGMAPGRFAVSLNSVLSFDSPEPATPVVLLLRSVLEQARSFDEAFETLKTTPIPSDCLLLLTGTRPGQLAVIERTPTRHAVRRASGGVLCVTNNYLVLESEAGASTSALGVTSCGRLERIGQLLETSKPRNLSDCLHLLADPQVKMDMTVQQMAFLAATGRYDLALPIAG